MELETQNFRTTKKVSVGSDLSLVTVSFIVKYRNQILKEKVFMKRDIDSCSPNPFTSRILI